MVRTIDFCRVFLEKSWKTVGPIRFNDYPRSKWHCSGAGTGTSGLLSPAQEILVEFSFNAQQWHEGPMSASRILKLHQAYQTWSNYIKLCATSSMRLLGHGHPSIEWMGADHPTIQQSRSKRPMGIISTCLSIWQGRRRLQINTWAAGHRFVTPQAPSSRDKKSPCLKKLTRCE
jgi:hypothetical protein